MFLLFSLPIAFSHPAELNLFGHDTAVILGHNRVELKYSLEFPIKTLALEMKQYIDDNNFEPKESVQPFMRQQIDEMTGFMSLEVDGKALFWENENPIPEKLKMKDGFAIFEIYLMATLPEDSKQISILNMNRAPDEAVFRSGLWIGDDIALIDSDLLRSPQRIGEHSHMRWEKMPDRREMRMHIHRRSDVATRLHRFWRRQFKVKQDYPLPVTEAVWDAKVWRWGTWWEPGPFLAVLMCLVSCLLGLTFGKKGSFKTTIFFSLACILSSFGLSTQPFMFKMISLFLLLIPLVGWFIKPNRWALIFSITCGALVLTTSPWVGGVSIVLGLVVMVIRIAVKSHLMSIKNKNS